MRVGKPGESVVTFVMQLRQNTKHCVFGNSLEEILGDCLVCGIVDGKMQCALLIDSKLPFTKCYNLSKQWKWPIGILGSCRHMINRIHIERCAALYMHLICTAVCICMRFIIVKKSTLVNAITPSYYSMKKCQFGDFICKYCKKTSHM